MTTKTKLIYIIGSIILGVVSLLGIFFGLISSGVINARQTKIVFSSASLEAVYDGEALVCDEWELVNGELKENHQAKVVISGSQTDVGSSVNYISATIVDENGADVTSHYEIEYQPGTLTVTQRKIEITAGSDEKVYDGTELKTEEYKISSGSILDNHKAEVTVGGSITTVGKVASTAFAIILDENEKDVTFNYDISYVEGNLEVTARPISVLSGSATKVYDGTAITNEDYEITDGSLLDNHQISVTMQGSQINAGNSDNKFTVTIQDEEGVDLTSNYSITYINGKLEVTARPISVLSGSAEKVYDGTALTNEDYEIIDGSLLDNHQISVTTLGVQIDAGSSYNSFNSVILDDNDNNVTTNYLIDEVEGVLTVLPYSITISTASSIKEYDGLPLQLKEWTLESELIDGQKIEDVIFIAEQLEAGTCNNVIETIIVSEATGENVSKNYDINYFFGTLTVLPRNITVRSATASKDYDGTPLTCPEWSITSITKPLQGHTIQVAVSGTITEVGETENTIAEVLITDEEGSNVTFNYNVIYELGILTIKNSGINPSVDGNGGKLNQSGIIGLPEGETEPFTVLKINSTSSGTVYLRYMNYGDYTGTQWLYATQYSPLINNTYSANYLTSIALQKSGYASTSMKVELLIGNYLLPYYMALDGSNYQIQTSDVTYTGNTSEIYQLEYYFYNYANNPNVLNNSNLGEYSQYELAYRDFVYKNYIYVPNSTIEYMLQVISEQGFNKTDAQIIAKIAQYIQNAAQYDLKYDRTLDTESDIAVAFLKDYKKGICQHYALAATMLYRALGIPARMTTGFVGNAVAGEWVDVTSKNAHAWVEVYIDGIGWVQIEVTGGGPNGGGPGNGSGDGPGGGPGEGPGNGSGDGPGGGPGNGSGDGPGGPSINYEYIVKPSDVYLNIEEGSVLDASSLNIKLQGLTVLEKEGYTYSVAISGRQEGLGISHSVIESFTLFDPFGEDVTKQFKIEFSNGKLQVYVKEITVQASSATKTYDGTPLELNEWTQTGTLLEGHQIVVSVDGSLCLAGVEYNKVIVNIFDADGKDVTDIYKVNAKYGVLTVLPKTLTIVAGSAEKAYDGTELICNEFQLVAADEFSDPLGKGDQIFVEINSSLTEIGRCDNVISSVVIKDANGKDVTASYIINIINGKLKVTP